MKPHILIQLIGIVLIINACRVAQPFTNVTSTKTTLTKKGAVVAAHPLAANIGATILKKGGNAIDAAVAVSYALAVAYPRAGNIGGGGFMLFRQPNGAVHTLDFREKAPAAAHRDMYLDAKGNVIEGLSADGHLSAGVPGSVDGMWEAHKKFGKLPFKDLIQPAIDLANYGIALTQKEAEALNKAMPLFKKNSTATPVLVKPSGEWKAGDILLQKDLAHTLELIRDKGRAGFYEGETANKIIAEMKAGKGILTYNDLTNYHSVWRKAISIPYKNYTVISMAPPSSGGICMAQLLKMVENQPLTQWGFQSENTVHRIVEAERRTYSDRAKYMGDPDFVTIPQEKLLNSKYIASRIADFKADKATKSDQIAAGNLTVPLESEETTHFCIVDAEGGAVSITTTLNDNFGAKTVVSGAGFLLNDEMDDFSSKPGVMNMYGLIGSEANAIAPNKRMLSSMTPTIVLKDGKLLLVVGTPGGSTIITSVFQTIMNVIEHNMSASDAVNAPRFHHQWLPDVIYVEKDAIAPSIKEKLQQKGHTFKERGGIGKVEAILMRPDGTIEAAADKRGDDSAAGY
jgi:gamma-glutamyltranspeptidase / glutathione hydrolase